MAWLRILVMEKAVVLGFGMPVILSQAVSTCRQLAVQSLHYGLQWWEARDQCSVLCLCPPLSGPLFIGSAIVQPR